ncbi:hypothetical protein [Hydrogenobacter thermophilus]|uniref:hypothetical protein n=1 Tax=Hydrogenobacter thermophilus TaxID=940 RepID=UPI0030FA4EE6
MRHETILKELDKILREPNPAKKKELFLSLRESLASYIQRKEELKEKYGRAVQHLIGWYLSLWNNKPPEALSRTKWQDTVGKVLRELVIIYERNNADIDEIKKDYESFKNSKGWLRGDGSITRFRSVLSQIKQQSKWVSEENMRSMSEYESLWDEDDEMPF